MKQGFVIMPIGYSDLDKVYREAIVPALQACNIEPKRVDKHTEGQILKSEIIGFIKSADIIIGDLTNERPNCYLEIGYTMGLDKYPNLILTCNEDHNVDSPNYKPGGPKVHFDLAGYDILWRNPSDLKNYKQELERKIKHRLSVIPLNQAEVSFWQDEWVSGNHQKAILGLENAGIKGFFEIAIKIPNTQLDVSQQSLLSAAREETEIHRSGWPIAPVIDASDSAPRAMKNGIFAEIVSRNGYDYWFLRKDGAFYSLRSLPEDREHDDTIFENIRINEVTESLLFAHSLYSGFGMPSNSNLVIGINYGGLIGRIIKGAYLHRKASAQNEYDCIFKVTPNEIETNLAGLVYNVIEPFLIIFDFYRIDKQVLERTVNDFKNRINTFRNIQPLSN